ncbi:hypothetical protein RIR_jg27037.t1 [Rhizophagus irregularis DAOM 181602=DAOM 197198]|nr:hypothetical protein RIR_jg27037.t1 [Rhizophagus irregularis DAOM 181602=DAOM 197198]
MSKMHYSPNELVQYNYEFKIEYCRVFGICIITNGFASSFFIDQKSLKSSKNIELTTINVNILYNLFS